jgi:hypothetical protein
MIIHKIVRAATRKIWLVLFLCAAGHILYAQDAEAIVRSSRDRIKAQTVSTRSRMVIRAKDGSATERLLDQFSKDGAAGKRSVIVFQQPASVAGSRFLIMENPGAADNRWVYLPSLGKVRRMAVSEGSGSFMGTDFTFDDISSASRGVSLDTHSLLRKENLGNIPCYVIQSVPKDTSYQYSKMIQWIDTDTLITLKIELYDKKNVLVKTVEISGLKDVQGRLTTTVMKMTTHAAGTSTTITTERIQYDDSIPESVFTTEFLETGRPR